MLNLGGDAVVTKMNWDATMLEYRDWAPILGNRGGKP
jgi:hypothetical protein